MDLVEISKKIYDKVCESEAIRGLIKERIKRSAKATAEYDKAIALAMVRLSSGERMKIDDVETPEKITASTVKDYAKGVCFIECMEKETAEGLLKSALKNLDALGNELAALENINKVSKYG